MGSTSGSVVTPLPCSHLLLALGGFCVGSKVMEHVLWGHCRCGCRCQDSRMKLRIISTFSRGEGHAIMKVKIFCLVALFMLGTFCASGALTYVSAQRDVSTRVSGWDFFPQLTPQSGSASSLETSGDFNQSLHTYGDRCYATQFSTLTPTRISGSGSAGLGSYMWGGADSTLQTTFTLNTETPYTLSLSLFNGPGSGAWFRLSSLANGDLYYTSGGPPSSCSFSGVLQPGEYTILAFARTGADGYDSSWSFDFEVVPEPSTCLVGALLLLPFGMQGIRHLRNRKQAA
jgi:hypothetical protein